METIWIWLNGKKTILGAIAANIVPWLIIRGYLADDTAVMIMGVINALTGMGLAHKATKARAAKIARTESDWVEGE